MEYYVRFADGAEEMVALTFGPMKKLIKAFEKEQEKQKTTDEKKSTDKGKSTDEKKATVICFG